MVYFLFQIDMEMSDKHCACSAEDSFVNWMVQNMCNITFCSMIPESEKSL